MSNYDPRKHHRRSIRLKGYDYAQEGLYFITVCVQHRKHLFGRIENGNMELNDAGEMVVRWYDELENKYPDKLCHEMVVMPNHFHCIIENVRANDDLNDGDWDAHVGAPLRGHPDNERGHPDNERGHPDNERGHPDNERGHPDNERGHPDNERGHPDNECANPNTPEKYGIHNKKYNATIGDVLDWFKTMTTNEYIRGVKNLGWQRFDGKLWQRNYWEHIIRDAAANERIAQYIINNPQKWDEDMLR